MLRIAALSASLAMSVLTQSHAVAGVSVPRAAAQPATPTQTASVQPRLEMAAPVVLGSWQGKARGHLAGSAGRAARTGGSAAALGGVLGSVLTLLRPAGRNQKAGVSYPLNRTVSLGLGYQFATSEDLDLEVAETGALGGDYNSHRVLVRARWQF